MRSTSEIIPQGQGWHQGWPQGRPNALPPGASRRSGSQYNCSSLVLLLLLAASDLNIGGRAAGPDCDRLWRSGQLAHVTIAFDGSRHALAIAGDPGIAYVARPWIDHVSCRID